MISRAFVDTQPKTIYSDTKTEGESMQISEDIKKFAQSIPSAELKENKGVFELGFVLAERKAFLSKQKLEYKAKFRVDDANKLVKFTEMLKESGSGVSGSGDMNDTPGFGFQKQTYKISGTRQETIEEQSDLFGKKYEYKFNWSAVRQNIEYIAKNAGYEFKYQITPAGL
jgi:hypothetical protein